MRPPRIDSPRLLGALVLIATFAAGWMASSAWNRPRRNEVTVNVRLSTRLPPELTALGLSSTQTDSLRRILVDGNRDVRGILREFDPRIRAAVDSVEARIRAVLTPVQRARFDASRVRREERSVDLDTAPH